MKITIRAPKPHSKKQEIIMHALSQEDIKEVWIACGSKFGKSLACATSLVGAAIPTSNTLWRWVAPIYLQTLIGKKYVGNLLPGKPYTQDNDSGICPQIKLIPNNTTFQFFHGQKPETLEGEGVHGYVLDEAAKMSEAVYESAYTTTSVTKGRFLICSTPLGKNWFYKRCMNAKDEMHEALKAGKIPHKLFLTAPTSANPHVDEKVLIEAKRTLPDFLYRQYYLAEFVDQSSVFYGFRECLTGSLVGGGKKLQVWLDQNSRRLDVVIGADWAKHDDYTVFTAWRTTGKPKIVGFLRFQDDYMASIKQLVWFAKQFRVVTMLRHDKTGVGDVLDEILMQTNLTFEGIAFTNESKARMVNSMILAIQQRKIELPNWPTLVEEFDSFEVAFTEIGRACFAAPAGGHDDVVASAILGYSAWEEFAGIEKSLLGLEDKEVEASLDATGYSENKTKDLLSAMLADEDDTEDDFQLFIS